MQKQIKEKLKEIIKEKWHAYNYKFGNYLEHFFSFFLILKVTSCHTKSSNYNLSPWHWFIWCQIPSFFPRNKLYNQINKEIRFPPYEPSKYHQLQVLIQIKRHEFVISQKLLSSYYLWCQISFITHKLETLIINDHYHNSMQYLWISSGWKLTALFSG